MNDTQTHFVAVCPHCSTDLRIRRVFAGQPVKCKHCEKTFVATDGETPDTSGSVEGGASPSDPTGSQSERIAIACPNCHTSLSVRRIYIGRSVRCKRCDEPFRVEEPTTGAIPSPGSQPDQPETDGKFAAIKAELDRRHQDLTARYDHLQAELDRAKAVQAEHDRLSSENQDLRAGNDRLQAEVDRLASECDRFRDAHETLQAGHEEAATENRQLLTQLDELRSENSRLHDAHDHTTNALEALRADLGGIAPADIGPLVQERDALTAEVEQLKGEMQRLRQENTALEQQRIAMENESNLARIELDRLNALIKERDAELESARADQDRLGLARQRGQDEVEEARAALVEREHCLQVESDRLRDEAEGLRSEGDQLRSELERLRRDLADAEQSRREGIARLETQLADLTEEHQQLQEQHEATDRACREHQERNQELRADLDRLGASQPAPASNDELQSARAEVASLKQELNASQRLQDEMAAMLRGIGIRFREL